jgi:hypothetical protein
MTDLKVGSKDDVPEAPACWSPIAWAMEHNPAARLRLSSLVRPVVILIFCKSL